MRVGTVVALVALALACAGAGGCKSKSNEPAREPEAEPPAPAVEPSLAAARELHPDRTIWVNAWRETSPLRQARAGVAVAEANGFIYVMGGVTGKDFVATTEYAQIMADGSLGPFAPGPPMNVERGFFAAVVHGGHIYVLGGGRGPYGKILLRTAERAKINPDGSLGPWMLEESKMNMPRRCAKAVLVGDTIYAIGGFGGDMLASVEHAKINADGSLGEWLEEGEKLTTYRYISGVKKVGEHTYVVGGHHQVYGVGTTSVERSHVVDEAGFGPWTELSSSLETERYGLSVVAHDGKLFALGGITGTEYLDSVEVTRVKADGDLEPWRPAKIELAEPLAMFGAVAYRDFVYVIGGTEVTTYKNIVWYAEVDEAGELGAWITPEEKVQLDATLRARDQKQRELPNQGKVVETIPAARYLYVKVDSKARGSEWLAAPSVDVSVGDEVRYGNGVPMQDFYSKELEREFPLVIFVGEIRKIAPATE